jgi:hypothetical protein
MARFHEDHIGKAQKITGYILSILFSFQIFMAGIMKVIGNPDMTENMAKLGSIGENIFLVGIGELFLLLFYWLPQSRKLGFYLLCSFVGGIIATELIGGRPIFIGISTATLLYAGTIMRFPSLIMNQKKPAKKIA